MTGLGRGLDALINTQQGLNPNGSSSIHEVELALINANPNQPRTFFDEEALEELSASIRELGVISPITLRKNQDGSYLIIAGERRFRAAKMAGLNTIPAYVKTAADEQVMEMALIENIQREDLNAIEVSLAYDRLMKDYNMTQERLSERVGKKRATIANYLRLLHLPAEIQMGITERKIDMGHARALLSTDDPKLQLELYKRIQHEGLSVRKVEEIIREGKRGEEKPDAPAKPKNDKVNEKALRALYGLKVSVKTDEKGKGKVVFEFKSQEERDALLEKLKG